MELRPLGKTGIRVSILGLGTVKLGRNQGVKYPGAFELPDDASAARLLSVAHDLGINLIDTAPAYGASEERLGKLLKGQRDSWIISTKAGEEFRERCLPIRFFAPAIRASVERSLRRLGTDRIDLLLIHSDGQIEHHLDSAGLIGELASLRTSGKIRAFGVSTKSPQGALAAIERSDAVMLTLNTAYQDDLPAIAAAKAKAVGVLIKKALQSGHGSPEENLRYCVSHPGVTSVILGTVNPDHLRRNCAIVDPSPTR